jgi:ABC-type antimicrobial peptide transport system permease subunit
MRRTLRHGMGELRAHPLRATLAFLSLIIGVLAVVAISTTSAVTADMFVAEAEQSNGRLPTYGAQVDALQWDAATVAQVLAAGAGLQQAGGAIALSAMPGRPAAFAQSDAAALGAAHTEAGLDLVAGDLQRIRRLPMVSGRWFDPGHVYPPELVVNKAFADRWAGGGTISAMFTADRPPIEVVIVGVVADGATAPIAYAPMAAILQIRPAVLDSATVMALAHATTVSRGALAEAVQRMQRAAGGTEEPVRQVDMVEGMLTKLAAQERAFLLVAALALLVSTVGILNIGLASVSERARELVTRRAIGATRAGIVMQMLLGALLIGLAAAAVAIVAAWIGVQWWADATIDPASALDRPQVPWTACVWGLLAACAATLCGAAAPAVVASRLDIAGALRD